MTLDALPAAALVCDPAGTIVDANLRACVLFRGDLAGESVDTLFPAEAQLDKRLRDAPVRLHALRAGDIPFTADVETGPLPGGGLLITVAEISGRRLVEESTRYLDASFEHLPIGMGLFNTNGQYVRVNAALCELLDRSPGQLLGRRDQEFTHPDDREPDLAATTAILAGELRTHQCEKRFVRPDGTVVWTQANLYFLRDEEGHPLCWLGSFHCIVDHDQLTGIANRRRLIADLELHLAHAARHDERGAVLVLDLDAGDAALAAVAVALHRRLRVTDTLGHMGDGKFAAVLPHLDQKAARAVAGELVEAVLHAAPEGIAAHCGLALYSPDLPAAADVLLAAAAADAARIAA